MLHVDIPSSSQLKTLVAVRADACVSLYLPTTPISQDAQADRTALRNLGRDALRQLEAGGLDKRRLQALEAQIAELADDHEFWNFQARSLAVLLTPERLVSFRLPNRLEPLAQASDRFHLKPLLRAVTFPQEALVLALSQNDARLVHVLGDLPPERIRVPDMPADAASAVGKASLADRAPVGRIQGQEGLKVRLRQYARKVDLAIQPHLAGRETPLLVAAAEPLDVIFREVSAYPHLGPETIRGNADRITDSELAEAARPLIDRHNRTTLEGIHALYAARAGEDRATDDLARAARAATMGAVDTLLINIDEVIPGTLDERDGSITFADAESAGSYGIVDEIAGRALLSGARVLGVRRDDLPAGPHLAAILRWSI